MMWTCPKCGRTFKRQEQSHYCGKASETVDEYIAAQPGGTAVPERSEGSIACGVAGSGRTDFLEYADILEEV